MAFHTAPPVVYPVLRSRRWAALLCGLFCLSGLVLALWFSARAAGTFALAAGLLLWSVSGYAAWRSWRAPLPRFVCWDGQAWQLDYGSPSDTLVMKDVQVCLDLQTSVWVVVRPFEGRPLWLWLDADAMTHRWMDFRRALYSPRSRGADRTSPDGTY